MRRIATVMALEAASLAVMAGLHLGGVLHRGSHPYSRSSAGTAEAVICGVLFAGAALLALRGEAARRFALGTLVFAIAGFVIGLNFTIRGGSAIDVAYHASVLPLLILTAIPLLRARRPG